MSHLFDPLQLETELKTIGQMAKNDNKFRAFLRVIQVGRAMEDGGLAESLATVNAGPFAMLRPSRLACAENIPANRSPPVPFPTALLLRQVNWYKAR